MSLEILKSDNGLDLLKRESIFKKNSGFIKATQTNKSLQEISFDTKFSEDQKCLDTKGDFYNSNVNFNLLFNDVSNRNNEKFFFYYQKYALEDPIVSAGVSPTIGVPISTSYVPTIYFEYDKGTEKRKIPITIELNKRACFVNLKNIGIEYHINPEDEKINFILKFVYTDYLDKRDFDKEKDEYILEKKYNAIIINTSDIEGFVALGDQLAIGKHVRENIISIFAEKITSNAEDFALKFLYENMPDFVSQKLLDVLIEKFGFSFSKKSGQEQKTRNLAEEFLWKHIEILSSYDDKGLLSWTKDSSGALLNLLRVFKNSSFLFESFKNNQSLIKRIFNNLDNTSILDGEQCSNKTIFANFINALCYDNAYTGLRMLNKVFVIGKNYGFSSGSFFQEEKENEFFMQQLKNTTVKETIIIPDDLPSQVQRLEVDKTQLAPIDNGNMYHPMDIIRIEFEDEKDFAFPFASAIVIKALAEERESQELEKNIRIGLNVFMIVVGTATMLTTGNPAIFTLAFADVALATADTIITVNREEIAAMSGGKEFLDKWEKVYVIGGLVLAAPATIEFLFARAMGLYRATVIIKNYKYANFFKSCIIKIIMERQILSFAGNTIKEGSGIEIKILEYNSKSISKATSFFFNENKIKNLYEAGAILVEIEGKEYSLIYKGESLIQGTSKDRLLNDFYKEVARLYFNPKKLLAFLEEHYNLKNLPNGVLTHANLGDFALPGNPKKSTLPGKMKGGGHGQDNLDYLDKIGRDYLIEHEYQNGVRIGAVEGHDSKIKRISQGQNITGQSWFPADWDLQKIKNAGRFVIDNNFKAFKNVQDGIPIFDIFEGVRVGVMKTNGKPATIFPDNAYQPLPNSKKFEYNPF